MAAIQPRDDRPSPGHIRPLTGLRFVAATFVLLAHSQLLLGQSPGVLLNAELTMGQSALTWFFCASGFVLTWNYVDSPVARRAPGAVSGYFAGRIARVYPVYLLALVAAVGIFADPLTTDDVPSFVLHAALLQAWLPDIGDVQRFHPVAWSLSVEAFMYVTFPLVLLVLRRLRHASTTALTLVVIGLAGISTVAALVGHLAEADALAFADPDSASRWLRFFPPARWPVFLAGCVLALLCLRGARPPGILVAATGVVTVVLWLSPALTADYDTATGAGYSAFGWDAAWLPFVLLGTLWLATNPVAPVARWLGGDRMLLLGGASYGLYLTHQFLLVPLSGAQGASAGVPVLELLGPQSILRTLVAWGLAVMASIGLFALFEEPARRRLRTRLGRESTSRAEAEIAAAGRRLT